VILAAAAAAAYVYAGPAAVTSITAQLQGLS